jgi:hypothetical protein
MSFEEIKVKQKGQKKRQRMRMIEGKGDERE